MEFKTRLVQLRKESNLTQEEFARKIGYTRTAVSAWEIGRNEPSNADTLKIADFFGVSTDYLLGKSDIRNPEKDIITDTPEIRAIARDVAKLKPEKKELFKNLLKQMSDEADEASKK